MDPFELLPFAALTALASIVALTCASREEPSRSRTAWLVGATLVLGVVTTAVAALFSAIFFAVLAWGEDSDFFTGLFVVGPVAIVIAGAVLTTQGVHRARRAFPDGASAVATLPGVAAD